MAASIAGCGLITICGLDGFGGQIGFDNLDAWAQRGLSCSQAWTANYLRQDPCLPVRLPEEQGQQHRPGLQARLLALGCPLPPLPGPRAGETRERRVTRAAPLAGRGQQCQPIPSETNCGVPVGGGGPSCQPSWLGNAQLRYAAGGVGAMDNLPGFDGVAYDVRALLVPRLRRADRGRPGTRPCLVFDPLTVPSASSTTSPVAAACACTEPRAFRTSSASCTSTRRRADGSSTPSTGARTSSAPPAYGDQTVLASDPSHPIQASYNGSNQLVSGHLSGWTERDLHLPPQR